MTSVLSARLSGPAAPKKVRRRPWSSAEKEAIWRQLGVHVLVQSVPGKEVCQRCLDLEPVLRGRHWKDIKNQVHNQIQSQKKQQFHAQMDLEENQEHQDQIQNQNQKKQQLQQYQNEMDQQAKDHTQNQKKQPYQAQMDQEDPQKRPQYHAQSDHQDHLHIHKKPLCHSRLDQDHSQVLKKQLYHLDQHQLQTLDRDPSVLTVSPYGPDGPLRVPTHPLLDREPGISPYPVLHRVPVPHMDQLLSRPEWTDEGLTQNYISRPLGRNLLPDVPPGGPPPDPHPGHVHF